MRETLGTRMGVAYVYFFAKIFGTRLLFKLPEWDGGSHLKVMEVLVVH